MIDRLAEKLELLRQRRMALIVEREGRIVFESPETRVTALVSFLRDRPEEMRGATVTDKVVGAAAAKLCIHGGAGEVFARIGSEAGLEALQGAGIPAAAQEVVPVILNQDRTGMCPMERMSREIGSPEGLFQTLVQRMAPR